MQPAKQTYTTAFLKQLPLICFAFLFFGSKAQNINITSRIIDLPGSFNRDGLREMCRDDEGFVWFGTNEGVWRYDGTDVKLLDYKKLKLPQNTAPFLLYCYRQFLFFSLISGETRVYNKLTGECNVYDLKSWITNIHIAPGSGLLLFTRDGAVWKFTAGRLLEKAFDLSTFKNAGRNLRIEKNAVDSAGNIYIFTRGQIGQVSKKTIVWGQPADINGDAQKNDFKIVLSVALTSKYLVANYYNGEAIIYDKQTLAPVYIHAGRDFAGCLAFNGQIILVPRNIPIAANIPPSRFFQLVPVAMQGLANIYSYAGFNTGNKFLLSSNAGLFEIYVGSVDNNTNAGQAKLISFFRNKSVRSIYRVNNNMYVGSYAGFYSCNADSIHKITGDIVYAIKQIDNNTLLLAIEGGTGFASYNCVTGQYQVISSRLPDHDFYITALYNDGGAWIGGDFSWLCHIKEEKGLWFTERFLIDSSFGVIRQIKRIRGQLYIAAQDGVSRLDAQNKPVKVYPVDAPLRVYCMQETNDGMWLGTHGNGLVKIDDGGKIIQQIGFNEGLAGNFVYSLAVMNNLLVAGTSNGVSIFNISNGMSPLLVQANDSLLGSSTQECNHSAVYYDSALNRVVLGGVNGLLFMDRKDYENAAGERHNRLILSYIKTAERQTLSAEADLFAYAKGNIVLKPEDVNITLKFASPDNPSQADGLFRINGLDDKWQRIKINQEVNLYALPPGTYTLQARLPSAINPNEWFSKTIIVQPAFYQTAWFKVLIAACALYIAWSIWRSKVRKIEREHQLRAMIASDLHDDIGSTLNSISVYTEVASRQLQPESDKVKGLLDNMGVASRDMIDRMSDIVWTINPKNDDFENVLERMKFFAAELLSGKNILLDFQVDDRVKKAKFGMQVRKNIYLIYKEAVNNAFKYSGATGVQVRLQKEGYNLVMSVCDNGSGFTNTGKSGGGNGLVNMKARAKEIGGKLNIASSAETGTAVQLFLKIG